MTVLQITQSKMLFNRVLNKALLRFLSVVSRFSSELFLNVCGSSCKWKRFLIKVSKSRYIALFVYSRSIKKLFSVDCVNIYLFSIFFQSIFLGGKGWGYPALFISLLINFEVSIILIQDLISQPQIIKGCFENYFSIFQ